MRKGKELKPEEYSGYIIKFWKIYDRECGSGVYGEGPGSSGIGVRGHSSGTNGYGGYFTSTNYRGMYATSYSPGRYAGLFEGGAGVGILGDLYVSGTKSGYKLGVWRY